MASGPEGTEPANYKQTWVLKVSIHCHGCEKKMKRILHKVKGVYSIDIDAEQNRVRVTGNVDSESLIQMLLKYGKHAELLPEKNPTTPTNSSNAAAAAPAAKTEAKGNEKAVPVAAEAAAPETKEKKQAEKGKAVIESPAATAVADEVSAPKPDTAAPPSKPEKNISEKAVATADADSKKKGKEVKREEGKVDERDFSDTVSAAAGVNPPSANPFPANHQPLYTTVSYHAVHPSTSYAYYEAPPPEMSSSYVYYGNPTPLAYPPPAGNSPEYQYSSESYYRAVDQPPASAGSYDMFNDENPNACKLM